MNCPFCLDSTSHVIDSRLSKEGDLIRRRRECDTCHKRFTTYERVEELMPLIIKKDLRREAYGRKKLVMGIQKACEKKPGSMEKIEELADQVEREVRELGEKEIPSRELGERIMQGLHQLDQIAYVRFASVYREFKDANQFLDELKGLLKETKKK